MSSQKISKIILNNNSYYFVEEVKQACPVFFYGCAKTSRMIIDKKKINNSDYLYATYAPKSFKWKQSDETIKSAKLLLSCDWVERNVPNWKTEDGIISNEQKLDIESVPPLLELKDEEKFKDENGNIIEIETRGSKTLDGIYFYGKDVERMLEINNLSTVLLNENSGYNISIHYKKFLRTSLINYESSSNKLSPNETGNLQAMYLTYFGLVKMLITTRNKIAEKFQKWAMKTLFTIQIGNESQKEKLATKILNINIETYRNIFKRHSTSLPCIYLTELGKVKDLKETFDINDTIYKENINNNIYKFGFTDDIDRRLSEHQNDYGQLKNVNLQLTKFTMVEPRYIIEAEKDLRQFFENFNKRLIVKIDKNEKTKNNEKLSYDSHLNDKNRYELIILNRDELETVFKYYKFLGNEYAGSTTELQNKIEKMKNEIERMKNEIELNKLEKENQKDKYENELLKKEMEILKLQYEKDNNKNMYEYTLKERDNKDEVYKLQIENYKLQLELGKR
jgi:hypothetical protein